MNPFPAPYDGMMSAVEFKDMVTELGLTPAELASWLGIQLRQVQRYASGLVPVPTTTARMLNLMLRQKLKPEDV